jgi:hypothetical protein
MRWNGVMALYVLLYRMHRSEWNRHRMSELVSSECRVTHSIVALRRSPDDWNSRLQWPSIS